MSLRLCDLGVTIQGTWLEECIAQLHDELKNRGLRLRPHCWLSEEWFSPHGVPGIAIPFYLAHPRLMRIERQQMFEVEGGTRIECMKLLRHEAGHTIQQAYLLHRRRQWQRLFGLASTRYPDYYRPNPASKNHVVHLDAWYAQSHPEEDFAETFAVWLNPRSKWRSRYASWPVLRKLQYVDEVMGELEGVAPRVKSRARPDALPTLKQSLNDYYVRKRERYSPGFSNAYDRDLKRLFLAQEAVNSGAEPAARFLRRNRREIRERVSRWTGEYAFTLDRVLKDMIGRCRELSLYAVGNEHDLKTEFSILLTVHTTEHVYARREWHPL